MATGRKTSTAATLKPSNSGLSFKTFDFHVNPQRRAGERHRLASNKGVSLMSRTVLLSLLLLGSGTASAAMAQTGKDLRFEVSNREDGHVHLRLRRDWSNDEDRDWNHGWNGAFSWSQDYALADLSGLSADAISRGGPVRFTITRPAGRFECSGKAADKLAEGDCSFTVNEAFNKMLSDHGIERPTHNQYFALALTGVGVELVDAVKREGMGTPTPDQLTGLGIFHVTPDFIHDMAHLNGMEVHIGDLVQFKIFKITPELARDYAGLGYGKLTPRDLVQFSIFHVSPETIRGFKDAGYRDLSSRDLQQFSIFHVTPDYIRGLADAGYKDLKPPMLVQMHMYGVTAAYAKTVAERTGSKPSPEELIRMRLTGMTPRAVGAQSWRRDRSWTDDRGSQN